MGGHRAATGVAKLDADDEKACSSEEFTPALIFRIGRTRNDIPPPCVCTTHGSAPPTLSGRLMYTVTSLPPEPAMVVVVVVTTSAIGAPCANPQAPPPRSPRFLRRTRAGPRAETRRSTTVVVAGRRGPAVPGRRLCVGPTADRCRSWRQDRLGDQCHAATIHPFATRTPV